MTDLSPADLSRRVRRDDVAVIDVRPAADFAAWHVPGSVNVDVSDTLETEPEAAADALAALPAGREIVIVGAGGPPAERAAALLRERGYTVSTTGCHRP